MVSGERWGGGQRAGPDASRADCTVVRGSTFEVPRAADPPSEPRASARGQPAGAMDSRNEDEHEHDDEDEPAPSVVGAALRGRPRRRALRWACRARGRGRERPPLTPALSPLRGARERSERGSSRPED
jgi:hypothetical protein